MCASYQAIDGPGGILASSGPLLVRTSDGLPVTGSMEFDSADISKMQAGGNFPTVVLHEMAHIIGMG